VGAASVIALLLAEGGYRLALRARGTPYDAAAVEQEVLGVLTSLHRIDLGRPEAPSSPEEPSSEDAWLVNDVHPYFAFQGPIFDKRIAQEVRYFKTEQSRATFDIVVLGGSVAAGFYNWGGPTLEKILEADPRLGGRKVRVLGHGRSAFKQPQQVNVLTYLLCLGHQPDCVIELDGFNEVAIACGNSQAGMNPLYPAIGDWAPLVRGSQVGREALELVLTARERRQRAQSLANAWRNWGCYRSAILGKLALARVHRLRLDIGELQSRMVLELRKLDKRRALMGPVFDKELSAAVETGIRAWSECSRTLDAMCRARGILYVHVLQPTLHDGGSKPLTDGEVRNGSLPPEWIEGVKRGYPELRASGAELAKLGVNFLDASGIFREQREQLYDDGCHFNRQGNELLAAAVAEFVLARVSLPQAPAEGVGPLAR
jgi:hypothetical protein